MNTIRIYLAGNGSVFELKKDFILYQGQFQNKLLNVYVPTSILAPQFSEQTAGQTTSDYIGNCRKNRYDLYGNQRQSQSQQNLLYAIS